jgi:hypothetical protein
VPEEFGARWHSSKCWRKVGDERKRNELGGAAMELFAERKKR